MTSPEMPILKTLTLPVWVRILVPQPPTNSLILLHIFQFPCSDFRREFRTLATCILGVRTSSHVSVRRSYAQRPFFLWRAFSAGQTRIVSQAFAGITARKFRTSRAAGASRVASLGTLQARVQV